MDHSANLYYLQRTAEVIGQTRDPYYLPLLKKRRANLDPATIQRAAPWLKDQVQQIIARVQRDLDEAIAALEKTGPSG